MAEERQDKQQFNIYLPPELIRAVKYAAIDHDKSLSAFVEDALKMHLKLLEASSLDKGKKKAIKAVLKEEL